MTNDSVISAIDVGTNTFHMVTATVTSDLIFHTISKDKISVRLGSGEPEMKSLSEPAMARAVKAFKLFAKIAKNENAEIIAIATSAVREAENQRDFIGRVKEETGIEIQVISGIEEARLIFLGMNHALSVFNKKSLTIDIGGGSTETIIGFKGEVLYSSSNKLGAIRLTKEFFPNNKYNFESINNCKRYILGKWQPTLERLSDFNVDISVGCSGTIQTLVMMTYLSTKNVLPENINGIKVKTKELLETIGKLKLAKNSKEISKTPGLDTKRADIILAGALILEIIIEFLAIKEITISTYALKEGIAYDYIQKTKNYQLNGYLSKIRLNSIYQICTRYQADIKHAEFIKELCLSMFDQLRDIHNLGAEARELLTAASLLHDIGFYISHDSHHKHSFYLIMNSNMPGFTMTEAELIANIARYHRKSMPKEKHDNFNYLDEDDKKLIWILGGILRIAEGLDRRRNSIIESVRIDIRDEYLKFTISSENEDPDLELWGATRRKEMLEKALGLKIIVDKV